MSVTIFALTSYAKSNSDTPSTNSNANTEAVTDEVVTDEVVTDEVVTDEVVTDEAVTDEVVTDEVVTDEVVTDEVATDEVATDEVVTDEVVTDEIVTEPAHICEIDRATESYHRYSCEECDNHSRVYHSEETMTVLVKNEYFHTFECDDCGYEYAARHTLKTAYNATSHYKVCADCGYKSAEESHNIVNNFAGNYHYVECDDCLYTAERHIRVTYTTFDAISCQATCSECGITEVIAHEWNGFECENCGYKLGLFSFAVVADIEYNYDEGEDRYYTIEFVVNDDYVWVDVDYVDFHSWAFNEGDFVQIFHSGNNIYDIAILVDGDVVDEPANFVQYVQETLILAGMPEDMSFEDIIIDEIYSEGDNTIINFVSERIELEITTPYVVYDLRDSSAYDIYEGDAILTYCPLGTITYIVVLW